MLPTPVFNQIVHATLSLLANGFSCMGSITLSLSAIDLNRVGFAIRSSFFFELLPRQRTLRNPFLDFPAFRPLHRVLPTFFPLSLEHALQFVATLRTRLDALPMPRPHAI